MSNIGYVCTPTHGLGTVTEQSLRVGNMENGNKYMAFNLICGTKTVYCTVYDQKIIDEYQSKIRAGSLIEFSGDVRQRKGTDEKWYTYTMVKLLEIVKAASLNSDQAVMEPTEAEIASAPF